MDLGKRIRQLRISHHFTEGDLSVSRGHLCRVELGQQQPSLEMIERLCGCFGIGVGTFFGAEEKFSATLLLEDDLVKDVLPFLKSLNEAQRKEILITLEAAPKSELTRRRILKESKRSIGSKDSGTTFQTSPIPSLPLGPLQKKMEYRKQQHF